MSFIFFINCLLYTFYHHIHQLFFSSFWKKIQFCCPLLLMWFSRVHEYMPSLTDCLADVNFTITFLFSVSFFYNWLPFNTTLFFKIYFSLIFSLTLLSFHREDTTLCSLEENIFLNISGILPPSNNESLLICSSWSMHDDRPFPLFCNTSPTPHPPSASLV